MTLATQSAVNVPHEQGDQPDHSQRPPRLTLPVLFGLLIGRRASIRAAARDRATIWVGLLFVIAAGFAREYDGEDLRREPWHLVIPLAASLVLSLPMYAVSRRRDVADQPQFWTGYCTFLGLFWLTAPMALLYAVPWERLLSPVGSVKANLWTLAFVATWRVLLMSRVVSVVTARPFGASLFLVMLVADVAAAVALFAVPMPVLQVMGGIRLTEAERVLQDVGFVARAVSIVTLPVWLVGGFVVLLKRYDGRPPELGAARHAGAVGPFALAGACVAVWLFVLPHTQREQRLRDDAERLLHSGDIAQALDEMSSRARGDYPPAWDPPPRLGWPEPERPPVIEVMEVIAARGTTGWVRDVYLDKLERRHLGENLRWFPDDWPRVARVLETLPEGAALRAKYEHRIALVEQAMMPSTTQPTTGVAR